MRTAISDSCAQLAGVLEALPRAPPVGFPSGAPARGRLSRLGPGLSRTHRAPLRARPLKSGQSRASAGGIASGSMESSSDRHPRSSTHARTLRLDACPLFHYTDHMERVRSRGLPVAGPRTKASCNMPARARQISNRVRLGISEVETVNVVVEAASNCSE